jgi:hypothetical protein
MIAIFTFVVMAAIAYAMLREGLFTALCYLFNVIFAGLIAFHVWPPLADELESSMTGTFLDSYEDGFALVVVFVAVLALMRLLTNQLANREIDLPPKMVQVGGGIVGLIIGYLVAGFLTCVMQTLPWDENFLGYEAPDQPSFTAKALPPDQVWLKLMARAHEVVFDDEMADPQGETFRAYSYLFSRHRRFTESRGPLPYSAPPASGGSAPGVVPKRDPNAPPIVPKRDPNAPPIVPKRTPGGPPIIPKRTPGPVNPGPMNPMNPDGSNADQPKNN